MYCTIVNIKGILFSFLKSLWGCFLIAKVVYWGFTAYVKYKRMTIISKMSRNWGRGVNKWQYAIERFLTHY